MRACLRLGLLRATPRRGILHARANSTSSGSGSGSGSSGSGSGSGSASGTTGGGAGGGAGGGGKPREEVVIDGGTWERLLNFESRVQELTELGKNVLRQKENMGLLGAEVRSLQNHVEYVLEQAKMSQKIAGGAVAVAMLVGAIGTTQNYNVTGGGGGGGQPGPQGRPGNPGPMGQQGLQGLQGPVGPQGERGDRGAKGDRGEKGERGEQGKRGERGDEGKPGRIDHKQLNEVVDSKVEKTLRVLKKDAELALAKEKQLEDARFNNERKLLQVSRATLYLPSSG